MIAYILLGITIGGGFVYPMSIPPEMFKCTVRGTAYVESGKVESPYRTDGCVMIRHKTKDNALELRYSGRWVMIPFPQHGGHVEFAYRWGSPVATVGGRETPIAWGDTEGKE